jgi:hypothetical protein
MIIETYSKLEKKEAEETRKHKAYFRHVSKEMKKEFENSKCVAPISVGQEIHEGDKFCAALRLINRSFKEVIILVNDSVQWYTHAITNSSKTEKELYENALQEGDFWIKRNTHYMKDTLKIPYKLLRWDYWLQHKDFNYYLDKLWNLYRNDAQYKKAIDENIEEFLLRMKKRNIEIDYDRAYLLCLKYLLEECASMLLWIEEKCHFQIYPQKINKSMNATYEKLIKPMHPTLLREAPYRIR